MDLSPDKRTLRVALTAELSATEVDELIAKLAAHRASMEPPVPKYPPRPGSGVTLSVQNDPSVTARSLVDGGVRLYMRSGGLGWLAFNFTASQGIALRHLFTACALDEKHGPNLSADELVKRGTAH
ncbi:hypothetical protein ACW73L_07340 [Methylolobus aquaticus]